MATSIFTIIQNSIIITVNPLKITIHLRVRVNRFIVVDLGTFPHYPHQKIRLPADLKNPSKIVAHTCVVSAKLFTFCKSDSNFEYNIRKLAVRTGKKIFLILYFVCLIVSSLGGQEAKSRVNMRLEQIFADQNGAHFLARNFRGQSI